LGITLAHDAQGSRNEILGDEVPRRTDCSRGKASIDALIDPALNEICIDEFGGHWHMDLPRGSIIGIVQLMDCQSMLEARPIDNDDRICGVWSPDRVAWKRGQFLALSRPMPFVGKQGLWNGPDQVLGMPPTIPGRLA